MGIRTYCCIRCPGSSNFSQDNNELPFLKISQRRRRESDSTETGISTAGRESLRGAPGADSTPLEVHHKRFRSQSREGTEQKLIALCFDCHAHAHHRTST